MAQLQSAPKLDHLINLGHEWREVCRDRGAERIWMGDLQERDIRTRYHRMVEDGAIIPVKRKLADESYIVFAKISNKVNPKQAHREFVGRMQRSVVLSYHQRARHAKLGEVV